MDWSAEVKKRYPWIEFVQKNETQRGQAYTMNMLLQRVPAFTFWIHWEETWEARSPFLLEGLAVMESKPTLTQLQLTFYRGNVSWLDVAPERITCLSAPYPHCMIKMDEDFDAHAPYDKRRFTIEKWPLYSLLPSINRSSFYKNVGPFSEDPSM